MNIRFKPILKSIAITPILVIIFELTSRFSGLFLPSYFVNRYIYKDDPYFHKFLDKKKLEYFCDFIHKKDKASYESSIYFFNETKELNLKNEIIWFLGGSTTKGKYCKESRWVDTYKKISQNNNIKNYAEGGVSSDYSIKRLEKLLLDRTSTNSPLPKYIFWGHWINEYMFVTNKKYEDHNRKINKNLKTPNFKKERYFSKRIFSKIFETLYYKSYFFRLITNISSNIKRNLTIDELKHHFNEDDVLPTSLFNSIEEWKYYSLSNYKVNLEKLRDLSLKYNFKVVLFLPPRYINYYEKINPSLNDLFEKEFIPPVQSLMQDFSSKYNWKFIDLNKSLDSIFDK